MRITYKVGLVGGIPIAIAAAIAVIAWLLLVEAQRTREGAVLAGSVHRDLLGAMTERNNYMGAQAGERPFHGARFDEATGRGLSRLASLAEVARTDAHRQRTQETRDALARYRERMLALRAVTERNDRLTADMAERVDTLIRLTDQARERQHASNAHIIASLTEGDRKLRLARDIVDRAHELRAAIAAVWVQEARAEAGPAERSAAPAEPLSFTLARMRNSAQDLLRVLREDRRDTPANELFTLVRNADAEITGASGATAMRPIRERTAQQQLAEWVERLIKINSTEQRAQHEQVAELLTYSVNAGETEQATQNIAIASLKLGRRTADALAGRDAGAADRILEESSTLATTVASLPISPLIQSDMIDAIARWREGLATSAQGLREQNVTISGMDAIAAEMIQGAERLDELFTSDAERIGDFVRHILILGAAIGLLLGAGTAWIVARSITEPLRRLKDNMLELAADPRSGLITDTARRDELGAMARAANFFVHEIRRHDACGAAGDAVEPDPGRKARLSRPARGGRGARDQHAARRRAHHLDRP
jgi:HAMP domain-containing protein